MSDINKVALTWRLFFETKDLFKKYIFLEFEYFISLEYCKLHFSAARQTRRFIVRKLYVLFLQYVLVTYLYLHDLNRYYQRACQNKVKRKKIMEMCCSLVLSFNFESQSSTDHTYVQDSLLPCACSRTITTNECSPWYNSHQGSINFLFLCLQQYIKRVLHQSLLPLFSSAAPCR